MTNAFIRAITLLLISGSLTGFAAASESKHHDSNVSASTPQSGCASATREEKKEKSEKKNSNRSQQEQEFDRVLMGIYG